jgi:lipoprotein-anchoring transpeptidase ErfK/SrfK
VAVARHHELTIFSGPRTGKRTLTLTNPTLAHGSLTLLVKKQQGSWIQTYLPSRPNGSLGWVRRDAVRLLTDTWKVVVRLRSHRLVVTRADQVIRTFPVAVGKPSTPTPVGHFFITELLKQPDPGGAYGPYAFGTSAYSDVLMQFGNGGNGQIGIHGTDEPWVIGTSASHGCVRLYNRDIVWLSHHIPLGTLVRISA